MGKELKTLVVFLWVLLMAGCGPHSPKVNVEPVVFDHPDEVIKTTSNAEEYWALADRRVFVVMAFLNTVGYDQEVPGMHTLFDGVPFKLAGNSARWAAQATCFDKFLYAIFKKSYTSHITRRRGTWLVFGLRNYRNAHGRWPTSLELVSEYAPGEAFLDPTCDDAFVYALDGDGFKLYSKGPNSIDEGGRDGYVKSLGRSEDDIAVWPLSQKGDKK